MFLMAQGRWVTKTGPNDARHVIWATNKFFFFFLLLQLYVFLTGISTFIIGTM